MPLRFAEAAPEADRFPLLIGHLFDAALVSAADQEIIYRDQVRMTIASFAAGSDGWPPRSRHLARRRVPRWR